MVLILGLLASLVVGDFLYWKGRYPPNCLLENIDVSGMKKLDVLHQLKRADVDASAMKPIVLHREGKKYEFFPSELGIKIDPRMSIRRTSGAAYQHNFVKELIRKVSGDTRPKVLPLAFKINKNTYSAFLKKIAKHTDRAEKDARIEILGKGKYSVVNEVIGKKLLVSRSVKNLQKALSNNLRVASIEVKSIKPRIYAKDLKAPPKGVLAKFTTYYGVHNSKNRVHNIKHAASKINDFILMPGETYSMLKATGSIDQKGGFKKAYVVIGSILDPQYGGGVCQVSTTLYNAAILAGLEIKERHNHSLYFNIYPLGRDASIYTGSKDLKFKNNTGYPVVIRALASNSSVTVQIHGIPIPGRRVYFTSPTVYIRGKRPSVDTPRQSNERIREILSQKKPFVSSIRMITYKNSRVIKKEEIKSRYRFAAFKYNTNVTAPEPCEFPDPELEI